MTEKECLEKMIVIWEYLWLNPEKGKTETYLDLGLEHDLNLCPCCEYVSKISKNEIGYKKCLVCPLGDFWPEGRCEVKRSPYKKWLESEDLDEKKKAATEIFFASINKLKEIE